LLGQEKKPPQQATKLKRATRLGANMDIRVKDKTFFKIDSQIAELLIHALPTVFERAEAPAKPIAAPAPEWGVGKSLSDKVCIIFKSGRETIYFDGEPASIAAAFGNRVPPADVVAHYTYLRNLPTPSAAISEAERAQIPYGGTANTKY
jgi:hypothetical protein